MVKTFTGNEIAGIPNATGIGIAFIAFILLSTVSTTASVGDIVPLRVLTGFFIEFKSSLTLFVVI